MKLFRKTKKEWQWFITNTIGLSLGMAALFVILLFAARELSYDRFHPNAARIYRVTLDSNNGATSMHPARVAGDWPKQVMADFPAIEQLVRLVPFRRAIIRIGDEKFYSERAFSTDSSFFRVFGFKVLSGDPEKAFAQPGRAFVSRDLAMKYFGNLNVVGKEISILHQQEPKPKVYVIDGVMENMPVRSHFHADLLTSFTEVADQTTWAYTYFLIKPGTDVETLRNTVQQKWIKESQAGSVVPVLYFQKLTDIHLFSHKSREMEKNGDIRSVILLISGALVILFIALINFTNLNRVRFIDNLKAVKIKLINGATRKKLALAMAAESTELALVSLLAGLFIAYRLSGLLGLSLFQSGQWALVALIGAGFVLVIAILSVIPLYTSRVSLNLAIVQPKGRLYAFPLVVQFTLAVAAIACTLVLNRQMNFLTGQHPASQNANMVVIAGNPWEAVQRYDRLKGELMKYPEIREMTGAMEEPGSDILDAVGYEMEGIQKKEGQSINIFTTDSNFFSALSIHPLAGTIEIGHVPSQEWEKNAVELSQLRSSGKADPQKIAELEKKVGNYREKYILNESALKLLGIAKPEDAVGRRFRLNFFLPDLFPEGEVVGVVPDFHYTNLHNPEKPLAIAPRKMFNYCFMIAIDPANRRKALSLISEAWRKINPEFPLQYEFMTDSYHKVYAGEYVQSRVIALFALISVIISALGIFSMASFKIQQRVKEIGIRKVNGARVGEVITLLNRDFVIWVAVAFVLATPVAWYAMHRWLENFAYKTSLSWWIFGLAGTLALATALLTVSFQSWRAATRNPVEALRYE
jgi:putative ABC transport system permease protein